MRDRVLLRYGFKGSPELQKIVLENETSEVRLYFLRFGPVVIRGALGARAGY